MYETIFYRHVPMPQRQHDDLSRFLREEHIASGWARIFQQLFEQQLLVLDNE